MNRIEYQQRMKRLVRERAVTGVVLGGLWFLAVTGLITGIASGRLQGAGYLWGGVGMAVAGLVGAYGIWSLWTSRAIKKHDLLCPSCCRSLAGKTGSSDAAFRCPHCGISIFSRNQPVA